MIIFDHVVTYKNLMTSVFALLSTAVLLTLHVCAGITTHTIFPFCLLIRHSKNL